MSSRAIESGSIRDIWRISYPLMLSSLSMTGMWFVDRMYLASYSLEALSAVAATSPFIWACTFGVEHLTSMGQVMVARFNGAEKYSRLGEPVWQMLWYALFSIPLFLMIAYFGGPLLFGGETLAEEKLQYFGCQMLVSPLYVFLAALSGFYVGQGKTRIVTLLSLFGNLVNVVLDPLLIFGWGPIPAYGIPGAVIATAIGLLVQVGVYFVLFMQPENREQRGSSRWQLQPAMLMSCLRKGAPLAAFVFFESLAWGMYYKMVDIRGPDFLLVAAISQSMLLFFLFFGIGLENGASAVTGNLIGAGKLDQVSEVFRSGMKLIVLFLFGVMTVMVFAGEWTVALFINQPAMAEGEVVLLTPERQAMLADILWFNLLGTMLYLAVEKIHWLGNGVLRATGDSRFIMASGIIGIWGFMVLPTYLCLIKWEIPLGWLWTISLLYSAVTGVVVAWRIYEGGWRRLIGDEGLTMEG